MATVVPSEYAAGVEERITLSSDPFGEGEIIPQRHTCDGTNTAPPLRWSGVPDGTAELVLVLEDPDAAGEGAFVHWMVADLDPLEIAEVGDGALPEGATLGVNDFGDATYKGPCPPQDDPPHRYVFTIVAVGEPLGLARRFTAEDLAAALDAAVILGKGVLTCRYGRQTLTGPKPPVHGG